MFIKEVVPSLIKDSRKEKTINIEIKTFEGSFSSSAPSGKSIGANETPMYNERGLGWSFKMLSNFCKQIKNKNFLIKDFQGLLEFETLIKEFEEKYGKLGANITYALETAFLKAAAKSNKKELWEFIIGDESYKKLKFPTPICNCIGGGLHSKNQKHPDFQEFLLIPQEETFSKSVTRAINAYEEAYSLIKKTQKSFFLKRNDENAWKTILTNEETLKILRIIADKYNMKIGLDIAASSFFKKNSYEYQNKRFTRDRLDQISYIQKLIDSYKLFYVEDPLEQEDFSGFSKLSKSDNCLITGDDLTTTSLERIRKAIKNKSINAVIIKPNQNGYLLSVKEIVDYCKKNNLKIIFSHRSGETMDDALGDYTIGFKADFIKTGINGQERLIKLKRIFDILKKNHSNL
jgi:enolase